MTHLDATRCPLCGELNQCAMEIENETGIQQDACWCVGVDFTADLLAKVPADQQQLACICRKCSTSSTLLN